MSLAPEGYPFVAGMALMAMATWIAAIAGFGGGVTLVIAALFTALTLFNLWFFQRSETPPSYWSWLGTRPR